MLKNTFSILKLTLTVLQSSNYILTAALCPQGQSGSRRGTDSSRVQNKAKASCTVSLIAAHTTTPSLSMLSPSL